MTYEEEVNATARNWNRRSVVTQYVIDNIDKDVNIIDFGAGKFLAQTNILRKEGFNVFPYDIGKSGEGLDKIDKHGDYLLIASNVLNVQPSYKELVNTLLDISSFNPRSIVMNYPKSPRKGGFTIDEVIEEMKWVFFTYNIKKEKNELITLV